MLRAVEYAPPMETLTDEHPLRLNTGRTIYHFHTRTKTGRVPQLQDAAPDVWIEISIIDAERLELSEGDLARVESARGSIEGRVRVSGVREGVIFVPFHYGWWDRPDGVSRAANELTITGWDPVSKQPLFKGGAVRVIKLADSDGALSPAPSNTASVPVT